MEKPNILFHYLYRDSGNYKIFGERVFRNREGLSPEKAEQILRKKLIDQEYFYPSQNKIPLFKEHQESLFFYGWYEFQEFCYTKEEVSDPRTLTEFLAEFSS